MTTWTNISDVATTWAEKYFPHSPGDYWPQGFWPVLYWPMFFWPTSSYLWSEDSYDNSDAWSAVT